MKTTKTQTITLDSLIKPFMGLELSDSDLNPHAWTPAKGVIIGLIRNCDYQSGQTLMALGDKASELRHKRETQRSDTDTDYRLGALNDQSEKLELQLEEYRVLKDILKAYYKSVFGVPYEERASAPKKKASPKAMTANLARADAIIAKYSNLEVVA